MKRKITRYLAIGAVIFIATSLIISGLVDKRSTRDWDGIAQTGTLRIVIERNENECSLDSFPHKCFHYELARCFADSMHLKLNVSVDNNLKRSIKNLDLGKYDIIAQTIPVSYDIQKDVNFSAPISINKLVLVQHKRNHITTHFQLAKDTVVVTRNSPVITRIKNLSEEIGDSVFFRETDQSCYELIEQVRQGNLKHCVCDLRSAKLYANDLDYSLEIGLLQVESWAIRKNTPILKEKLDSFLTKFQKTKAFQDLYNQYYK